MPAPGEAQPQDPPDPTSVENPSWDARRVARDYFGDMAAWAAQKAGSKWAFGVAAGSVLVWALAGPLFGFSEGWELVINTGTTIVTFLMVFLIQNAQNRESKAVQLKLDELLRAVQGAEDELIDIENLTEQQIEQIAARYRKFAEGYRAHHAAAFRELVVDVEGVDDRADDAGSPTPRGRDQSVLPPGPAHVLEEPT